MDANERPLCVSCLAEGRKHTLTQKEVEGCERLGIPYNCSMQVGRMISLKLQQEKQAQRAEAKVLKKARGQEQKSDDELYVKELEEFLRVNRTFINNQLLWSGLLPFRKLDDAHSRIVIRKKDLREFLVAVRDEDPRIPLRVRATIIACGVPFPK